MPATIAALVLLLAPRAVPQSAPQAADRPVLRYVPRHEELKYTFGGAAPTHHVAPGTHGQLDHGEWLLDIHLPSAS